MGWFSGKKGSQAFEHEGPGVEIPADETQPPAEPTPTLFFPVEHDAFVKGADTVMAEAIAQGKFEQQWVRLIGPSEAMNPSGAYDVIQYMVEGESKSAPLLKADEKSAHIANILLTKLSISKTLPLLPSAEDDGVEQELFAAVQKYAQMMDKEGKLAVVWGDVLNQVSAVDPELAGRMAHMAFKERSTKLTGLSGAEAYSLNVAFSGALDASRVLANYGYFYNSAVISNDLCAFADKARLIVSPESRAVLREDNKRIVDAWKQVIAANPDAESRAVAEKAMAEVVLPAPNVM